jgi:hypothetical protein
MSFQSRSAATTSGESHDFLPLMSASIPSEPTMLESAMLK